MRSSICAQSCASVPPAPAWMSRKALCASISPRNMRLQLERAHLRFPGAPRRSRCRARRASSFSLSASSRISARIVDRLAGALELRDLALRRARSRPSSCARSGLDHKPGSSSSRATSSRRSFFDRIQRNPRKEPMRSPRSRSCRLRRFSSMAMMLTEAPARCHRPRGAADGPRAAAAAARPDSH